VNILLKQEDFMLTQHIPQSLSDTLFVVHHVNLILISLMAACAIALVAMSTIVTRQIMSVWGVLALGYGIATFILGRVLFLNSVEALGTRFSGPVREHLTPSQKDATSRP
jgi:hypothetical protein